MYAGRPSVCRNCGALVGAGESACAVCGSPAGFVPQPERQERQQASHDRETMRFARAVLTRPSTFTFVFLAVNVFIFLLMSFSGPGGSENNEVLRAYGAKYNSLINEGEWWRLVTPVFLHIGWLHLFVNMYSLFILGPYVEKLYGSAKFVFFWIATGVVGVVASYLASGSGVHNSSGLIARFLFRGGDGPSAGASGALFGLIGVLFVFGIKFRHELPEGFKRAFGTGMIPTILINLFIGYTLPFIDNAAHLGGFVAGAVFALFVGYKRPGQRASVAVFWHVLQFVALALVIAGFGQVARHIGDAPHPFALTSPEAQALEAEMRRAQVVESYVKAINAGQTALIAAFNKRDAEAAKSALAELDGVASLDPQPDQLRLDLRQLIVRAGDLARLSETERKRDGARDQLLQLSKDFDTWEKRYSGWVEAEGEKYHIHLEKKEAAPPGENKDAAPATTTTAAATPEKN